MVQDEVQALCRSLRERDVDIFPLGGIVTTNDKESQRESRTQEIWAYSMQKDTRR